MRENETANTRRARAEDLENEIASLKHSPVAKTIARRIRSFKKLKKKSEREIFKELCFCILTANYNAAGAIRIQRAIGDGFIFWPYRKLALSLRKNGYRFPNTRASYICKARSHIPFLKNISYSSGASAREWLVKNILGLGYKEASHFLRNIGFDDVAIIDFHIIDLLARHGLIKKPKTRSLSRKTYLRIEKKLRMLAKKMSLTLAELDLYLWYIETGKVLK